MEDFIFLYIILCSSVLFKIEKEKIKSSNILSVLNYRQSGCFKT